MTSIRTGTSSAKISQQQWEQYKEYLENVYGRRTLISKSWLEQDLKRFAKSEGDSLEKIFAELKDCTRCKLCENRTQIVFGEGNPNAELMFVGEGPGEQEDRQGRPFVGAAGQLLDKIIEAMGYKRSDVFIANVVKCRPPGNRNPEPDEMSSCEPFLYRQIKLVRPKVIVGLGSTALKSLMADPEIKISKIRGSFQDFTVPGWSQAQELPKLMPTFHPAYLLRNPESKKEVWEDMKKVIAFLGRK